MQDSLFFKRESKRSFISREVPQEVLERLFERIRWSPSNSNNQPWRFIFVTEPEQHARFMTALKRGNQWASTAPVLIAVCARQSDDATREDDPVMYYQFDCGLAVMSLLLGAVDEGLMAHPMAGFHAEGIHEVLEIPKEYHVMCVIALGYRGPIDLLDDRTRQKDEQPRVRKPVPEIISINKFNF